MFQLALLVRHIDKQEYVLWNTLSLTLPPFVPLWRY